MRDVWLNPSPLSARLYMVQASTRVLLGKALFSGCRSNAHFFLLGDFAFRRIGSSHAEHERSPGFGMSARVLARRRNESFLQPLYFVRANNQYDEAVTWGADDLLLFGVSASCLESAASLDVPS